MKMKTGPKVALLAILFVGLGYWAGRGFPQTWDALLHPNRAPASVQAGDYGESGAARGGGSVTSRRVDELEDRVAELEAKVTELRSGAALQAPSAPGASTPGYTTPVEPGQTPPMTAPQPVAPDASPFPATAPEGSL